MFSKHVRFFQNQNIKMSIGTFSMRQIRPCGRIWSPNQGFSWFLGVGDFAVFYGLYMPYRPCLGLRLGCTSSQSLFAKLTRQPCQRRSPAERPPPTSTRQLRSGQMDENHEVGVCCARHTSSSSSCSTGRCVCLLTKRTGLLVQQEERRRVQRHAFLFNKKSHPLFQQADVFLDMSSCWTRRHVLLSDKKTCLLD